MRKLLFAVALSLLASATLAQAPADSFRTRLLTAAFTPADGPTAGDGAATAEIVGRRIRIAGGFIELGSPVRRVQVRTGAEVGVPGLKVVAELPVSGTGGSGAFSGEIPATAANLALLRGQRLYVQVETQANPDGALWGWFMPNQAFPGQDAPEKANPYAR